MSDFAPGTKFMVNHEDGLCRCSGIVTILDNHPKDPYGTYIVRSSLPDHGTWWVKDVFKNNCPGFKVRLLNHHNTKLGKILYR